jgi:hypothetical protein
MNMNKMEDKPKEKGDLLEIYDKILENSSKGPLAPRSPIAVGFGTGSTYWTSYIIAERIRRSMEEPAKPQKKIRGRERDSVPLKNTECIPRFPKVC